MPPFMRPPGEEPEEVAPYLEERTLDAPLVIAREKALSKVKLNTANILGEISRIHDILARGTEEVRDVTGEVLYVPLGRDQLTAIKIRLDSYHRMLNKAMPDIRQVQIEDKTDSEKPLRIVMDFGDD